MTAGSSKSAREPIPFTPMHKLYCEVRKLGQKRRLELANDYIDDPALLDTLFRDSVEAYENRYSNVGEPFHPTDRQLQRLEPGSDIDRGYNLASILAYPRGQQWQIQGAKAEHTFRFVDYETAPLRTTGGATYEETGKRGRGPVADLLLIAADGSPIVGEVKAATATRYDTDAVMALIQALTLAAALATPQQKQRIADHYSDAAFDKERQLFVFVLSVKPPIPAKAKYQAVGRPVGTRTQLQARLAEDRLGPRRLT